jgi:hypothetical protein
MHAACSLFVVWYILGADTAVLVVAVFKTVPIHEPPDAHLELVIPFGPVLDILAHEVTFLNFVLLPLNLLTMLSFLMYCLAALALLHSLWFFPPFYLPAACLLLLLGR